MCASSLPQQEQPPRENIFQRAGSSLRSSRDFRFLWLTNLFFIGGNWTVTLVLGWLVFEVTGSELMLAIFAAIRQAPLWAGPFFGLIADRFDRTIIIRIVAAWSLVIVGLLAILTSMNATPYWLLLISSLLLGIAQSLAQPARASLMLEMVGRENLANANALNSMGIGITQAVSAAIGGGIVSLVGSAWALGYAALWFALSAIMMWQVRPAPRKTVQVERVPMLPMVTDGIRIVLRNRLTTTVIVVTLAANILVWPVHYSFLPVFASDVLNLGPAGLGRLMMFSGIGGFIGAFIIASLGDFRLKGGVFIFGSIIWASGMAIFGLSQTAILSYVILFVIGIISAAFNVLQIPLMLMTSAPEVRGRAMGVLELAIGAGPIGTLLMGVFANTFGVGPTTFVGAILFIGVLITVAIRVPDFVRYTGKEAETNVARI